MYCLRDQLALLNLVPWALYLSMNFALINLTELPILCSRTFLVCPSFSYFQFSYHQNFFIWPLDQQNQHNKIYIITEALTRSQSEKEMCQSLVSVMLYLISHGNCDDNSIIIWLEEKWWSSPSSEVHLILERKNLWRHWNCRMLCSFAETSNNLQFRIKLSCCPCAQPAL